LGLNETLLGVIDELYAGALDQARLSSSLDGIGGMMGASGGIMYLIDEIEHRVIHVVSRNFQVDAPTQVDGEHATTIAAYHRRIPLGSVVHVHSLWPMEQMLKTPFYNEVLRRQDVLYGAACLFQRTARVHGLVTLNRSERAGPFDETSFRVLRILAPHVRRAVQVTTELGAAAQEREHFVTALDRLAVGVILTSEQGKALHLNSAAERILASGDGLAMRQGHTIPGSHLEQQRLRQLIGLATVNASSALLQRSGICAVRRPSGKPPWLLLVAPCGHLQAGDLVSKHPACLILIRDPEKQTGNAAFALQELFGLTAQESRIALAVSEGHGIAHVADEMRLSSLTVRNHLQRVFAKTGTSRQAELARFLGSLAI
jgi:DNA-binding CsgD family transcriptional regulator/PAS domain-containing protein